MKLRERVLTREPDLQSRAALVLLVELYRAKTRRYKPEWRTWLTFRKRFLNKKSKEGSLTCAYCGEPKLIKNGRVVGPRKQATIDHVMPLAKGGKKYDEDNLAVSCRTCNENKADTIVSL